MSRDIRIYRTARPWWAYPYSVIDGPWPGPCITVTATLRGAIRIAKRHSKRPKPTSRMTQLWPQEPE
jgi:hypothetical protein